jgi:hypothetical protein
VLPSRKDFTEYSTADNPSATVESVELQTGVPYATTLQYLARKKNYAMPGQTEPERVMTALVSSALSEYLTGPTIEQYSDRAVFGLRRFDLYAPVAITQPGAMLAEPRELCFEADGIQHFTTVAYWGGKPTVSDRQKARMILTESRSRPISMVALHYEVLTGPRRARMTEGDLIALVEYVQREDLPWVFVRPMGSTHMRATPRGFHPVLTTDVVANPNLEVFIISGSQPS